MRQVQFQTVCSKSDAELDAHRAYSRGLGLTPPKALAEKLAIVGGGASVLRHIDELKAWNGEVWAINGAARWCLEHLIPATLVSASPSLYPPRYLEGIERAILADTCHPWTFDALKRANVSIFDPDDNGPTSTVAAVMLAANIGYREIHCFGCEGSYDLTTHHYQHTPTPAEMVVAVGGKPFNTSVSYFLQSQLLAHAIAHCGTIFKDRSGGLLAALAADPEGWDVIRLPSEMAKEAA